MKSNIIHKPLGQKIVTIIVFVLLGMSFIGIFSNMLITEKIIIYLTWVAAVFSIIMVVTALYYYFKYTHFSDSTKNKSTLHIVLSTVTVLPSFAFLGLVQGLPPVLHYFTSTNASITVTVKSIPSSHYSKYCKGAVYIKEYSYFFNDKLCNINTKLWSTLSPGDKIFLVGQISPYSFTYDHYKANK